MQLLQRFQECDELTFLLVGQVHVEAAVVEVDQVLQVRRGAVVEVRSARRNSAQYRTLAAIDVDTFAGDQSLAGIRGVERQMATRVLRVDTSGDEVDRHVGLIELQQAGGNSRVTLV